MSLRNFFIDIGIFTFAKLPDFFIKLICRRQDSTDVCYLSLQNINELQHVVHASDGYMYEASYLKQWVNICLSEDKPIEVIPSKNIDSVRLIFTFEAVSDWFHTSWISSFWLQKIVKRSKEYNDEVAENDFIEDEAERSKIVSEHVCDTKVKQKQIMFRVIDNCVYRKILSNASNRPKILLFASDNSAFQLCEKN